MTCIMLDVHCNSMSSFGDHRGIPTEGSNRNRKPAQVAPQPKETVFDGCGPKNPWELGVASEVDSSLIAPSDRFPEFVCGFGTPELCQKSRSIFDASEKP